MAYYPSINTPDSYFPLPPKIPAAIVHVWGTTTFFDTRKSKQAYEASSSSSSKIRRSVGHASMSIHYGGNYYYQSFGPLPKYKDTELVNPFGAFSSGYNTQQDDLIIFDGKPDRSFTIHDLDFEKMIAFMANPSHDWNHYNLYAPLLYLCNKGFKNWG